MIWVGGGIIVHGLEVYGYPGLAHVIHDIALAVAHALGPIAGVMEWLVTAAGSGLVGLALGLLLIPVVGYVFSPLWRGAKGLVSKPA
jgi:predicted DNA repair protein MutK